MVWLRSYQIGRQHVKHGCGGEQQARESHGHDQPGCRDDAPGLGQPRDDSGAVVLTSHCTGRTAKAVRILTLTRTPQRQDPLHPATRSYAHAGTPGQGRGWHSVGLRAGVHPVPHLGCLECAQARKCRLPGHAQNRHEKEGPGTQAGPATSNDKRTEKIPGRWAPLDGRVNRSRRPPPQATTRPSELMD
jgi:hypothetical protein